MDTISPATADALRRFVFEHLDEAVVFLGADDQVLELNDAAWDFPVDVVRLFDLSRHDQDVLAFLDRLDAQRRASASIRRTVEWVDRTIELDGWKLDGRSVVILRDRTAERAREEEMRHLRRIEAIGMVSAALAHDFNNLLALVVCSSEALAERAGGETAELAAHVGDAAGRAAALVRDMLEVARVRSPDPTPVDVGEVLIELRPLLARVAGSEIELTTSVQGPIGCALIDRARLEHTLVNLVVNARDAMPDGGHLSITVSRDEHTVSLRVEDDGVGMTEEVRARVFERFYTTKAAGTGLGLASVKGFVRESGGAIAVESAPGRGTAIDILLPRVAPGSRPASRGEPDGASSDDGEPRRCCERASE